jgi:hypothetical protein
MSPDSIANDWELGNPQTWNRYAYARNNPLIYVDPDGAALVHERVDAGKMSPRPVVVIVIQLKYRDSKGLAG